LLFEHFNINESWNLRESEDRILFRESLVKRLNY